MRTLSKSDFKLARTCITKLYYKEHGYPQNTDENPYLAMLAEGGYMVEQLARQMYSDGIELEYGGSVQENWERTRELLTRENVTLFEATLLAGRKQARVDILVKRGARVDLIEVKSKSFDSSATTKFPLGPFRGKKGGISKDWVAYLEDVAFQQLVMEELYPDLAIVPHLLLVDKAKSTSSEGMPGMFSIRRNVDVEGRLRDLDVRFTGDPSAVVPFEFLSVLDVSEESDELMPGIREDVTRFLDLYLEDGVSKTSAPLSWDCKGCEYDMHGKHDRDGLVECWGELAAPKPHIFDLYQMGRINVDKQRLADHLISIGKTSLYDVPVDLLTTSFADRQRVQIEHTRDGTKWLHDCLKVELSQLSWPVHFIDFETSLLAIPYHKGMRPYEKVAFQWSCHTIHGPGQAPVHSEWLNDVDTWPNAEFVRTLRAAVGDEGKILTWSKYERTVMKDILGQLERYGVDDPELKEWLRSVIGTDEDSRLVDLCELCRKGYFHPGMGGSVSIKKVLDAIWKHDPTMRARYETWCGIAGDPATGPYEALPPVVVAGSEQNVNEGTGAMRAYQAIMYGAERENPEVVRTLRDLLIRYCRLDTMAMVLIWDHWRRETGLDPAV